MMGPADGLRRIWFSVIQGGAAFGALATNTKVLTLVMNVVEKIVMIARHFLVRIKRQMAMFPVSRLLVMAVALAVGFAWSLGSTVRVAVADDLPSQVLENVPGNVIYHSPATSGIYLGSAGIVQLDDGTLLAKCDEFGPSSSEHESAITHVFRSDDGGKRWRHVARIDGLFWSNIFVHRGGVYQMGTTKHHGLTVILRSDDKGVTWTKPVDAKSGLLTPTGQYHTAPMPVIIHAGRIWRAMEDASGGEQWGQRYMACMFSAPVDSDLLDASSWTISNRLARDAHWLDGDFGGWLEGNAVVTPSGHVVDILRVAHDRGGKAAIVDISDDGKTASFDPQTGFIDFPGGAKKFTIRYDEPSKRYWSLVSIVRPAYRQFKASSVRNTLALASSPDLRQWTVHDTVLQHDDHLKHGFQYVDWYFDGDDLVAAIRMAYDDGMGGAHNAHDANFLTCMRITGFRHRGHAENAAENAAENISVPAKE
ncbi:MAG: sialidase family protein [Pirellulaceae bacterium]